MSRAPRATRRLTTIAALAFPLIGAPGPLLAQHHGGGHHHHGSAGQGGATGPAVISYAPTAVLVWGPYGPVPYAPSLFVTSGGFPPMVPYAAPPVGYVPGPMGARLMNPGPIDPTLPAFGGMAGVGRAPARVDLASLRRPGPNARGITLSERASELLTFGDRHFRAGDLVHADRRYRQALEAAPFSAIPRVRLAQLEVVRGDYREASELIREAIIAEPDWLPRARDIQAIYAEPAAFHDALGRLEAHLQADPGDRDAWLVLGAELYLSGRTERAADVFLRLTDRKPDAALAALLDAATPED